MARSINDIQQQIIDKISSSTELSAFEVLTPNEISTNVPNSSSKVAIWRLIVYCIAFAIFVFESIMDAFKIEIEEKVKANRPHTKDWYKTKALAFQYGDNLVDSDEYEIIDIEKQIIKQVAIVEGDRKIFIKIATLDGTELVKLPDNSQVESFSSYIHKVKDAGTQIEIINEDADKLKINLDFYYDALVIDSEGIEINTGINIVETAIKSYLKSIDFNGEFDINKMIDYLQSSNGYKSLKLNYAGYKAGTMLEYNEIQRTYQPLSGYMKLEELSVTYYAVI